MTFTGQSFYTLDVMSGGKISKQRDVWDGIGDNSYFSLEGLSFVLQQLLNGQVKPSLQTWRAYLLSKSGFVSRNRAGGVCLFARLRRAGLLQFLT